MVDILHRVGVKSSVDKVYEALSTREGLARWWTTDTHGDCQVGGTITFRFSANGAEIGTIATEVRELTPGKRVAWQVVGGPNEWIGNQITFDLQASGEHAIVMFRHQGWKEPVDFMHHCSTKWAVYLMSLKSMIETGNGTPNPHDPHISGDGAD